MDHSAVVRFGPFAFDPVRMVLERGGDAVPIGGRGVAILAALVRAEGQVVTRNELLDAAWRGQVVEERNLTVQIAALRKAMGDLPDEESPIRTVSRVGYRLVPDGGARRAGAILALRPSVAVLPFADLSGDPELAFFPDGVTEDIIVALSRFQSLAVMGRGSSFAYKGRAVPAPEIAQALGVRYLLEGSVQRAGHDLRVTAQLVDAEEGTLLWADRFEEELDGLFEIQDRIAATVVGLVEPRITRAELERSRRKHPQDMDAYDHFLLGSALFEDPNRGATQYDRMVGHLDRSIELDPDFPLALARAGFAHEQRRTLGGASPPGVDDFARASELCGRALAGAGDDAVVLAIVAMERHTVEDDGEAALALTERALALSPHSGPVLGISAFIHRQRGRADLAIDLYEHRLRLDPASPFNAMLLENIGCCHLHEGRYPEAVGYIRRALALGASWDLALVNLAVAEALAGEAAAAGAALGRFLRIRPGATIQAVLERLPPGVRGAEGHIWREGLRRAGMPEG